MKKNVRFVCLFLALVMLCGLSACGSPSLGKKTEKTYCTFAFIDGDDTANLYLGPDTILKIPETVGAGLTGDRKNIVWLTLDNKVYVTPNENEKTDIKNATLVAEDVDFVNSIRNTGFLLCFKDGSLSTYRFEGGITAEISKEADNAIASYDFSSVYYTKGGKVYRFNSGSSEKIGSYDPDAEQYSFQDISDDGTWFIWSVYTADNIDVYSYNGKETVKVNSFKNSYDWYAGTVLLNKSQDQLLAYSYYDNCVFLLSKDGEPEKIRFKGTVDLPNSYLTRFSESSEKLSEVYAMVEKDDKDDLYWGSADGDTEKLFSEVRDFGISGNKLFYLTEEGDLYETPLKGGNTDSGERIARSVGALDAAPEGGIVYYMKNCEHVDDHGEGTLYVYKSGDKEPVKIAGGVYMYYYEFSYIDSVSAWTELRLADKGSTVLYLKNVETDDHYNTYGSLFCYRMGSDEPVRIMNESLEYLRYFGEDLKSDSFFVARYESANDDGTVVSWYYYDGKETQLIARDSAF